MSGAADYLNNVATGARTAGSGSKEEHIVINADRTITVPDSLRKLGVQYDHNIETVTFDCPRYWDDIDLSKMDIFINVKRADGVVFSTYCGKGSPDSSNSGIMNFDWLIPLGVTEVSGYLSFLVCIQELAIYDSDDQDSNSDVMRHWNSELCSDCYISPGLEGSKIEVGPGEGQTQHIMKELAALKASIGGSGNDSLHTKVSSLEAKLQEIEESIGDWDENLHSRLDSLASEIQAIKSSIGDGDDNDGDSLNTKINAIEAELQQVKEDIANTFVEGGGVLFTPSVSEEGVLSWSIEGSTEPPAPVNIKGSDGKDGTTFTPHVSEEGVLSWTNDDGLDNPDPVNLNSILKTEDWTFELEDGTTVIKKVVVL